MPWAAETKYTQPSSAVHMATVVLWAPRWFNNQKVRLLTMAQVMSKADVCFITVF